MVKSFRFVLKAQCESNRVVRCTTTITLEENNRPLKWVEEEARHMAYVMLEYELYKREEIHEDDFEEVSCEEITAEVEAFNDLLGDINIDV